MLIGILSCGHMPDEVRAAHGDYDTLYASLLDGRGLTFENYNVVDMEFPSSRTAADGWLISGSKHGAYEDHPFIPPLEDFIRDASTAQVPTVGICFGHQIIAQALSGKVEKFKGGWGLGRTEYRFEGAATLALNAWHQDQVIRAPEGAVTTSATDFCAHAALVYPDRAIFSVQPHPEFSAQVVKGIYEARKTVLDIPPDVIGGMLANLDQPLDNDRMADMIATHFLAHAKVGA